MTEKAKMIEDKVNQTHLELLLKKPCSITTHIKVSFTWADRWEEMMKKVKDYRFR